EELHHDRLVEAEARADRGDLLGVGVVASDHGSGIAGGEAEHQEYKNRDDQHDRNGRDDAAQDVAGHGSFARCSPLLPSPLWGGSTPREAWRRGGGNSENLRAQHLFARPPTPTPTPPHKGEGTETPRRAPYDGFFFSTFQNTGAGAVRIPVTFLRAA